MADEQDRPTKAAGYTAHQSAQYADVQGMADQYLRRFASTESAPTSAPSAQVSHVTREQLPPCEPI